MAVIQMNISSSRPTIAANLEQLRYLVFQGLKGETGDSAYDLAVSLGFEGTEAEWLASLKGEQGDQGDQGPAAQVVGYIDGNGILNIGNVEYHETADGIAVAADMSDWSVGKVVDAAALKDRLENLPAFSATVKSVNGQTGAVELRAEDVGALPDTTVIPTAPTKISELENDSGYLTAHQDISGKANTADLAAVAISGSYDDLTDKPTIPAAVSFATDTNMSDWTYGKAVDAAALKIDFQNALTALAGKVDKVDGRDLSSQDYTYGDKIKLAGIETGAQRNPTVMTQAEATAGMATTARTISARVLHDTIAAAIAEITDGDGVSY